MIAVESSHKINFYKASEDIDYIKIIRLLIENDADIDARDFLKHTPLISAMKNGRFEEIKISTEYGADTSIELLTSSDDITLLYRHAGIAAHIKEIPENPLTHQATVKEKLLQPIPRMSKKKN